VPLLLPVPADRRPARLALLVAGLAAYGVSVGLMLRAGLGVMPWSVLDQGLSEALGLEVGTWSIIVGAVVLVLWLPLRARPGVGTLANVVLVGLSINATLAVLPAVHAVPAQVLLLAAGILLNGIATGAYIGAGLGPGPRDGLTTGIAARGHSVRVVRTTVEVLVLAVGWLLGGTVGIGTLLYAVCIGPLMHRTLPALRLREKAAPSDCPAPR
jgi:uncharacterized membrane protein YczE